MNRRTELKLERAKVNLRKNFLSGNYIVRNTLVVLAVGTVVGGTVLATEIVNDNGADLAASAYVSIDTRVAEKAADNEVSDLTQVQVSEDKTYEVVLSEEETISGIDSLYAVVSDDSGVLTLANNTTNLTKSEYDMTGKFIVTTEGLNLRAEASEDANILVVMNTGDSGEVIEVNGDWTKVSSNGSEGYVKSEYIITDDAATEVAEQAATDGKSYRDIIGVEEVIVASAETTEATTQETTQATTEATTQAVAQVTTEAPTTEAPTTEAPTTEAPTTEAPTEAPTTEAATEAQVAEVPPSDDLYILAAVVYCEAGNQSYDGQLAVASVVMNRLYSGSYGSSILSVVSSPGQFSVYGTGAYYSALSTGGSETSLSAAAAAMSGSNNIGSYMYFRPTWNTPQSVYDSGNYVQIGDHIFY